LRQRSKLAGEFQTAHVRHIYVDQEEMQFLAVQFRQSIHSVNGLDHLIFDASQYDANHLAEAG
jgi:hypothetical protein